MEGAYLWEQREGYALLYGAAYLQENADAVLSALVHASETFAFAEGTQTTAQDADFNVAHTRLSADMSAATQTFTEAYSRSMENGDGEYASAMLEYVENCQSVQAECALLAAALEANPGWAQQYGQQYANAITACSILQEYLAFYADYYHSSDPLMQFSSNQLVARQPAILWHYESMMYTLLITQYDICAAPCSDQALSDEVELYQNCPGGRLRSAAFLRYRNCDRLH